MGLTLGADTQALSAWLAMASGAERVNILHAERLGGGAIQENYAMDVDCKGGSLHGQQDLVLRTDAPSAVAVSMTRSQEFMVLRAAHAAGVTVPTPLLLCEDSTVIGKPFYLMRRVDGNANPRELVRQPWQEECRRRLVECLGAELAKLHTLQPPQPDLDFLDDLGPQPAATRISVFRAYLDTLPAARPTLEWGLRWLERHAPVTEQRVLTHGDFRTGNLLVEEQQLAAILDWEFAAWSDPLEDIGWFCARCWRFGANDWEAGGIGRREDFYRGYQAESGRSIPVERIAYWEVMATLRWAIIALQQTGRHLSGEQTSLELALTGHIVPELCQDLLLQIRTLEGRG